MTGDAVVCHLGVLVAERGLGKGERKDGKSPVFEQSDKWQVAGEAEKRPGLLSHQA